MDSPGSEWVSLSQAAAILRKARRPRGLQTLRDRIRRGTLRGVRYGRFWYVYRPDILRLAQRPLRIRGGRPRSITPSSTAYAAGRLAVDIDEVLHQGTLSLETRFSGMLGAQALLFGIQHARLQARYPQLTSRDLVLKRFEELDHGERFTSVDVLRPGHPRPR